MADFKQYIEQLQDFDINNIDWDRVGVWPRPARVFLFALAMVLIVAACYFLVVKDKNVQHKTEQNKEVDLRSSFEVKASEAANLEEYKKQMKEMEESLGALVARLPKETEVPGLLEDIDDKGVESKLNIESIGLQNEVPTEFHIELPIKIVVAGGYHEFGSFVSGIAGMPRIVTLHDFSISRKASGTSASIGTSLTMDILAKTYRYKPQE